MSIAHFLPGKPDSDELRDEVVNYAEKQWMELKEKAPLALSGLLASAEDLSNFVKSHIGPTTFCNNEFAYIAATIYK